MSGEGGTSPFSWVAEPHSRFVVMATTSGQSPSQHAGASSVKGRCVERGGA